MGFMAGFGPAFSRSYELGRERAHQDKQDLFRFTMQDLISRRDADEARKREDRKYANKAQSLLEGSTAPSEAYEVVYDWVKSDLSEAEIKQRLATGKFTIEKPVDGPEKPQEADSVDQQMAATGLAPPAPVAPPAAPEARQGGILSGIFGPRKDPRQAAIEKAAGVAGLTPERANELMSDNSSYKEPVERTGRVSFTPGAPEREPDPFAANTNQAMFELAQAKEEAAGLGQLTPRLKQAQMRVNAIREAQIFENSLENGPGGVAASIWNGDQYVTTGQVQMNPDGTFTGDDGTVYTPDQVRIIGEDQKALVRDINQSLDKDTRDLSAKENDFTGTLHSVAIMSDIIRKTNGEVLAPRAPYVVKKGQEWLKDAAVGANELTKLFTESKPGEQVATREQYNQLLAAEARAMREDPADIGAQVGLFDIQKAIFAYRLAASMGQEGRSLAETERKMFTEMAVSGITPDRFHQGMADLLLPAAKMIDEMGNSIYSNNQYVKQHFDDYDYIPERYSHKSIIKKMEESSDPEIKDVWQKLGFFGRGQGSDTPQPAPAPAPTPQPQPQNFPKPSVKAIETLKSNPNTRAEFEEAFGPGSATAILGGP